MISIKLKASSKSKPRLRGFTLIEIIIVIIIIGILAAVVVPKFFDVQSTGDAQQTASLAAALNVASARNFTRSKLGKSSVSVTSCANVENALTKPLPVGFSISAVTSGSIGAGAEHTCRLTHTDSGQTADFTAIGV